MYHIAHVYYVFCSGVSDMNKSMFLIIPNTKMIKPSKHDSSRQDEYNLRYKHQQTLRNNTKTFYC